VTKGQDPKGTTIQLVMRPWLHETSYHAVTIHRYTIYYYSLVSIIDLPCDFVDEMKQHGQARLARILANDIGRSQVKQRGTQLGTHGVDQHVFARPVSPGNQH